MTLRHLKQHVKLIEKTTNQNRNDIYRTVPVNPGAVFLFLLHSQQIPYGHAKVFGDLVSCCGVEVFFSAHFKIGNDPSADPQLGAELAGGDVVLGAEGGDLGVNGGHGLFFVIQ